MGFLFGIIFMRREMDGVSVGIPAFLSCFTFFMSALHCAVSIRMGGRLK